ncbi:pentatricopeptide repeat-containing protein At3g13880 isoform X2 [Phalaenopsis equestris]|uniref:pentatricopeptide repeat-containing protein At3g13880 isoform X2 n=1 Tax=Phalaenopsis equestris TaxID=78828 RepID=UPI0009E24C43|nr:pentatricopeptide repeat-containing protein At3g13880 isoform X2 [Phalaenopsis equestris]
MQCSYKCLIGYLERSSYKLYKGFSTSLQSMDSLAYSDFLQSFTDTRSLALGKSIHSHMLRNHVKQNLFLQNNLLNMYCKCGDMNHAHKLFDAIPSKDIVSWNVLVSGYFQSGCSDEAINVFKAARTNQVSLDRFAYAGALSICSRTGNLSFGKAVHGLVVVDHLDDVSWNSLISAHLKIGLIFETLRIFAQMHLLRWKINCFAVGSILKCCSYSNELLEFGKMVHSSVIKAGLDNDVFVGSAMIDMYAKNGVLEEAINVFKAVANPNVVVFNAMISGFCQLKMESHDELAGKSLVLYSDMRRTGMMPSKFTFSTILRACNLTDSFELGKQIHAQVYKCALQFDEFIGSALIDLYSISGSIEDGLCCFHSMPKQDIVTWTSMISGYIQNECFERALSLFDNLLTVGRKPDEFTLSSVMSACANLAISRSGQQIQSYVTKAGFDQYTICGNAQIFMYARSGDIEAASKTFYEMDNHDVVSWSAMISCHAQHGCANDAIALFSEMKNCGVAPNDITFLGVLTACSHGGLVDEGFRYFENMKREYGIVPNMKHCACLVDLFGRSGRLDKAEKFIMNSGFQDDPIVWRSLLSSCRIHHDTERGKHVAERIMELDPYASATYVILYNMYLDSGRRSMALRTRKLMKERGVKKEPGLSWIEVGGSIHSFVAGDKTHPRSQEIYARLEEMISSIEKLGYISVTTEPGDLDLEQKVNLLNCHSEKLAVAFGILSLPKAAPIRVMKNLRVCVDCHTIMKLISAVEGREIVLRDPIRFHRYRDGSCSCGDYW